MRRDDGSPVIRLEGTFDVPSARLVANQLRRLAPGDAARVDFSRVRVVRDYAIAALAQALRNAEALDVRVAGLGRHHVRLLRYFGVEPRVFRSAARDGDGLE